MRGLYLPLTLKIWMAQPILGCHLFALACFEREVEDALAVMSARPYC